MRNANMKLFFVGILLLLIILTGLAWFYFENIGLYWETNSPLRKQWVSVQLNNGEILYGHVAGMTRSVMGFKDVYRLESFSPVAPPAAVATSTNFFMSGLGEDPAVSYKLIPVKAADTLFINRGSVVYWKYLDRADPLGVYLK